MSLTAGTRLGPYEVVSAIGAGGMGEVYRATDSNLKRSVAIKVLPAAMASDADRLVRFQREAEALAALNHPNIAAIYGLEKTATLTALVMELVEGEDLSAHMARGAMPLSELLPIARQIAAALEAAHEQGIIHRDIKPANVKVRADGVVKVLDFGLAKAMEPAGAASAEAMNSPTLTARATQLGVILGTAAYMAPEQARGRTIDKRVDIWAFGVVVFEMLAGTRAFSGDDITDTIVSVVSKEPDWSALPPATPAGLRRLLTRCLKKDPKARLRDIGDARLQIDELIAAPEDLDHARGALGQSRRARALPWAIAGALAVALVSALWAPWRDATTARVAAFPLTPLSFEQGGQTGAVWSPDGKAVAYGARQTETEPYQAYVRYLDSSVATQVTTTGVERVVTWTTAGKIVFVQDGRLWSVSPLGGEPEPFEKTGVIDPALKQWGEASVMRDGRAAALFRGADNMVSLWVWSPSSSQKRYDPAPFATSDVSNSPNVQFSPDGKQILLLRNSGAGEEAWLMPYPANAADPPHRVLHGVAAFTGTPTASWMPDNRHVVLSAGPTALLRQLYLGDTVTGALTVISSGTSGQGTPAVSPDGSKLVFLETTFDYDIVSVDLATAAVTKLIPTQRGEQMPAWAARESAMVYVTDRNGAFEIWLHKPGQPDRSLVTARDFPPDKTRAFYGPALSPDGKRVIYRSLELAGRGGLYISGVAGGRPAELMSSPGTSYPGSWSPDGNWYVYWHMKDGRRSLVKVKTTGGAEPEVLKASVNFARAWLPVWSPLNDWILFEDKGVKLISPDGRTTREVSPTSALAYTFSSDGRTIYGLRQPAPLGPVELFSIRVADGSQKLIGSLARDFMPSTSHGPALRLSVTPDGKSLTYSINQRSSNLWLMNGLKSLTGK